MGTFGELQTEVAAKLRDPSHLTFTTTDIAAICNTAIVEVGRLAPFRFQEDLSPVADQLSYQLQTAIFADETPEIEVRRVEIWDGDVTPNRFLRLMQPAHAQPVGMSAAGWEVWNGVLSIPNSWEDFIDPEKHIIRVWGYSPFPEQEDEDAELGLSSEQRQAVIAYARVEGLQRLVMDRDLFTQWQTRANNADVTPAQLYQQLSLAQEDWRRRGRQLTVLRER